MLPERLHKRGTLQELTFTTVEELEKELIKKVELHKLSQWGTGKAKTVKHLFKEIATGETRIFLQEDKIARYTRGVFIDVLYQSGGTTYHLVEDHQVFNDGRVRHRVKDNSVSEKMLPGEEQDIEGLMRRALTEELPQVSQRLGENWTTGLEFNNMTQVIYDEESESYPGIWSYKDGYKATVIFNDQQYIPEGYCEANEKITTYFVWEQLPDITDNQ